MKKITIVRAADMIADRVPFQISTGSLRGDAGVPYHPGSLGQLPTAQVREFEAVQRDITYIVWSYDTPIAWHVTGSGWYVPEVKYSVTTSKHQGIVRWAVTARAVPEALAERPSEGQSVADVLGGPRILERIRAAIRDADVSAAPVVENRQQDQFDPDNGAPVEPWRDPCSGEGALYSLEYLRAKTGREEH